MEKVTKTTAYVGLGSNLGDREHYLRNAIVALQQHPMIEVGAISPIYETEPIGGVPQGSFLNMCVKLVTNLSADLLLDYMLEIENMYGRMRHIRWGPRTIDIDLLLFGDEIRQDVHLQLPHPRMLERGFVLHPLAHIIESNEPMYTSVHEHLKKLDGKDGIKRWKMPAWHKEFVPFAN